MPDNPFDSPVTRSSVAANVQNWFIHRRNNNRGTKYQLFDRNGVQFMYGTRDRWSNKNVMLNTAARTFSWVSGLPTDYATRKDVEKMVRIVLDEMIARGDLVIREIQ